MDYILGASIVETCLQIIIDRWEINNKEVHGKEEAAKQQKRKATTAISVRALHNLQDQARPRNSFLFYQDLWEEIKHTSASKLEEFIVMKSRPITNGVSKWDKRATCKVKSIVEWIKTEGKNNKEAIERIDKKIETILGTKRTRNHKRKRKEGAV